MNVNYLNDSDLDFLQHCSEEQLANFARLLTHNEKGKTRLSSVLMRNELFKSMEGHPELQQFAIGSSQLYVQREFRSQLYLLYGKFAFGRNQHLIGKRQKLRMQILQSGESCNLFL